MMPESFMASVIEHFSKHFLLQHDIKLDYTYIDYFIYIILLPAYEARLWKFMTGK